MIVILCSNTGYIFDESCLFKKKLSAYFVLGIVLGATGDAKPRESSESARSVSLVPSIILAAH